MRVLNFYTKFQMGSIVQVKKTYTGGMFTLTVGVQGIVDKITIESLPQMSLFNLRVIHMKFGKEQLNMEESIAREYFRVI